LSITKKIAEAHQGRVWAGGGEKGATFFFALPVSKSLSRKGVEDDPDA